MVSIEVGTRRGVRELSWDEALGLLCSVPLGRVVFTDRAMPAIRPVNHLVDGKDVIIRCHRSAAVVRAVAGRSSSTVVAYEADDIDLGTRLGWSVIVLGMASLVPPEEAEQYASRLDPWVIGTRDDIIRIEIRQVTGFRLEPVD